MNKSDQLVNDLAKHISEKFSEQLEDKIDLADTHNQKLEITILAACFAVTIAAGTFARLWGKELGQDESISCVLKSIAQTALSKKFLDQKAKEVEKIVLKGRSA
jgi:hypothetical protein